MKKYEKLGFQVPYPFFSHGIWHLSLAYVVLMGDVDRRVSPIWPLSQHWVVYGSCWLSGLSDLQT